MWRRCCRERELRARVIHIGQVMHEKFPTNVIRNQKYNVVTFLPMVSFCASLPHATRHKKINVYLPVS